MGQLPRLKTIRATSQEGFSLIFAEFEYGTNLRDTQQQLDARLRQLTLPTGPNGAPLQPQSSTFNFSSQPVVNLSLKGNQNQNIEELSKWVREVAKPALATLKDVGGVQISGDSVQVVNITFDPAKLAAKGLSVDEVVNTLRANNLSFPSGTSTIKGQNLPVRTAFTFARPEDLGELVLAPAQGQGTTNPENASNPPTQTTTPGGQAPVLAFPKLKDVAKVEVVPTQVNGLSRIDGTPGVVIDIFKTQTGNTVIASDGVLTKIKELNQKYPAYKLDVIYDQAEEVRRSLEGLSREGLLGAVFAVVVIFVFIRSVRSTLVTAISIPTSIIVALILMWSQNITLNIFSLGGLAIAIGRVVDDAIVVLENIYRHLQEGEDVPTAIRSGTREVSGAIIGSTLTTVAVFLPLGFVGGLVSQFFLPFALTVTFAILASLVVALTVIPLFASLFIRPKSVKAENKATIIQKAYLPVLGWSLKHRLVTLLLAFGLLVGSIGLTVGVGIPFSFLGQGSDKLLTLNLTMPAGSSQEVVLKKAEEIEAVLKKEPTVRLYQTTIAGDSAYAQSQRASGGNVGDATVFVRLDAASNPNEVAKKLRTEFDKIKPQDGNIEVVPPGSFGGSNFSLTVQGPNADVVKQASDLILQTLQEGQIANLVNLKSDVSNKIPQVQVTPDPTRSPLGNVFLVGSQLRNLLQGQSAGTTTFGDGRNLEIRLLIPPLQSDNVEAYIETLKKLPFNGVTIGQVAEIKPVEAVVQTTRIDQQPAAVISADITTDDVAGVTEQVTARLNKLQLPGGATYLLTGASQQQAESFLGLGVAVLVAIGLVYLVMVILFGSLLEPFAILFSLPLALIGALIALVITQRAFGLPALIGLLLLVGIVVTNAIVLIDLVNQLRKQGYNKTDALLTAGRNRVRPILMTAIATILALMPLALGLNEGSIIAAELGTVVIGGLFSSTLLTLLVVPCVYSLLEGLKDRLTRQHRSDNGGGKGRSAEATSEATLAEKDKGKAVAAILNRPAQEGIG